MLLCVVSPVASSLKPEIDKRIIGASHSHHNRVCKQQYKSQAFRQVNASAVLHMFLKTGNQGLKRTAQHNPYHHIDYGLMAHVHGRIINPRAQKKHLLKQHKSPGQRIRPEHGPSHHGNKKHINITDRRRQTLQPPL